MLVKLLMNLFATLALLLYMQTLDHLADAAGDTTLSRSDLLNLGDPSPLLRAGAGLLLLLVATTLSVYRPRGMTRYGQRKLLDQRPLASA